MARIGILGGTFDPIHNGHTQSLVSIKNQLGLNEVWVMPNSVAPHKPQPLANSQQRLPMVQLATHDLAGILACDFELKQPGPSYTVKTLANLRHYYPQHQFYFIIGMDSLASFNKWYQWQDILKQCHLVVMQRPGNVALDPQQLTWYQQFKIEQTSEFGQIIMVETPMLNISSTQIRNSLKFEQDSSFDINPAVKRYIEQHNIYQ